LSHWNHATLNQLQIFPVLEELSDNLVRIFWPKMTRHVILNKLECAYVFKADSSYVTLAHKVDVGVLVCGDESNW
jgi:hypothetical protein